MRRLLRLLALLVTLALIAGGVLLGVRTRSEAHRLVTNPLASRKLPERTPIKDGLVYDDVQVTTADGLQLQGWYVPGTNGAVIIALHGFRSERGEMLNEAVMLRRHGYGVLLGSFRAHDLSDGNLITFGLQEIHDLEAWHRFAASRDGVDPERIALLGNSMGGSVGITYAAQNPQVKAVVANSAFSSLEDTIETSVRFFTGLPPFPFAPLIKFWAEREAGFRAADVDAKRWIGKISPRPVLLMQGGADVVISLESGRRLFEAAGEPKELWYEPEVGHTGFDRAKPDEYERRVVAFFDRYVVGR
ncbi:MAG TPA: alpha/beta hydrolase [Vicinamibacterales bacterium]|nr:alpha/beta hydrolase [Vicinamibacterales bacterium]